MVIKGVFGEWFDAVFVDGERLSPARSQRVVNHSPDGFAWGYGGSGPAQLALALLLEAGLDDVTAQRLHQDLKWDLVAVQPQDADFEVDFDMDGWVAEHRDPAWSAV
jgi:hypothetical protein